MLRRGRGVTAVFTILAVAVALLTTVPAPAGARARPLRPGLPSLPVGYAPGPPLPSAFGQRWNFASAYFPPADQIVVFGGSPIDLSTTWHDDTWLFVPRAGWSEGPAAPPELTPRGGAAMAFDPDIGKLVMFGGEARQADGSEVWPPYSSQTWLWDGTAWSKGPSAPPSLAPRTGAEMVYDDALHRIVLFGGSGLDRYTDTWLFDGSSWTPGPAAPPDMHPRVFFGMAYDAVVHRVVVGGGDGDRDVWLFDGTSWTPGPDFPTDIFDAERERTRMAFDPDLGAVLLFGGVGPGKAVEEIYYLRLATPGATWTEVPESPPVPGPQSPPEPRLDGGIAWVPTLDAMAFFGGVQANYSGQRSFRDLRFFRDIPPVPGSVTVGPDPPFQAIGLDATLGEVQGGYFSTATSVRWFKNGRLIQGQTEKHLDAQYQPGDVIQAQIQVIDGVGVSGPWVTSNAVTVARPQLESSSGVPGGTILVSGRGFGPNEDVDVHLDSPAGLLLGTEAADGFGSFFDQTLTLPDPLAGGSHRVYAIGRTTVTIALPATITVTPGAATVDPPSVAAGQTTTFSASGFLPGERVSVSFPGQPAVSGPADANGSFTIGLASPPEPAPGGNVTATAGSGWARASYTTVAAVTATGSPVPGAVPVSMTGFGAGEVIVVSLSGDLVKTVRADDTGSAQTVLTGPMSFGTFSVTASGVRSGQTAVTSVTLDATMAVDPAAGPSGTVITIDSGPGWIPLSQVAFYKGPRLVGVFTADLRGRVHAQTSMIGTPGVVTLTLIDQVLGQAATEQFTVTG